MSAPFAAGISIEDKIVSDHTDSLDQTISLKVRQVIRFLRLLNLIKRELLL